MSDKKPFKPFHSADKEIVDAEQMPATIQTSSDAFKLAFADREFLLRDELRPVRLQLELLKPELIQQEQDIQSTIVVFGSSRIPEPKTAKKNRDEAKRAAKLNPKDERLQKEAAIAERIYNKSQYYEASREFSKLVSSNSQNQEARAYVVITGGGPGIMEAANRGAKDVDAKSIALNVVVPHEQLPNPYVTPELTFQFHYFAIRKMHFLIRAKALVIFPGGFGTLDELFEALTLLQTRKIDPIPVILFGKEYWENVINFNFLVEEGVIKNADLALFQYAETASQAWQIICDFYN